MKFSIISGIRFKLVSLFLLISYSVFPQANLKLESIGLYSVDTLLIQNFPNISFSSHLESNTRLIKFANNSVFLFNPNNKSSDPEYKNEYLNIYSKTLNYKIEQSSHPIEYYSVISTNNSSVNAQDIDSLFILLHYEKDTDYYQGDSNYGNTSERTPGEGWIWAYLSKAGKFKYQLPDFTNKLNYPVTIYLKARGVSRDSNFNPDHKLTMKYNGVSIAKSFTGYTYSDSVFYFNSKSNSLNAVEITSNGITGTVVDKIYIDNFRLTGSFTAILDTSLIEIKDAQKSKVNDGFLTFKSNTSRNYILIDTLSKQIIFPEKLDSNSTYKTVTFNLNSVSSNILFIADINSNKVLPSLISVNYENPDLNDENYVIITHPDFLDFANEYRNYKSSDLDFKIKVVTTESIYFKYSNNNPSPYSIKSYLTEQKKKNPNLKYVMLVGNSSWDYRSITASGSQKRDFVPTFGVPASDQWFISLNPQKPFESSLCIGRIPISKNEEGSDYLNKIIYQSNAVKNEKNSKRFVFINGGFDKSEQRTFFNQTSNLINSYVNSTFIKGVSDTIIKRTDGYIDAGIETPKIQSAFHDGMVWVNYIGHAGSRTWDLMLNDPNQLPDTKGIFPFITSLTCFTGDYANPNQESFSESFVLNPTKGAIAFVGTSGLGYVSYDEILVKQIFGSLLLTRNKTLSESLNDAKNYLVKTYPNNSLAKEIIREYTYFGDPTLKLPISNFPDLSILKESALTKTDKNNFNLKLKFMNAGKMISDSVDVRVYDSKDSSPKLIDSKRIFSNSLFTESNHQFELVETGLHHLSATVNWVTQTDSLTENNSFEFSAFIPKNTIEFLNLESGKILGNNLKTIYLYAPQQQMLNWVVKNSSKLVVSSGLKTVNQLDSIQIDLTGFNHDDLASIYFTNDLDTVSSEFWIALKSTPIANSYSTPHFISGNDDVEVNKNKANFKKSTLSVSLTSAGYFSGNYGNITVGGVTYSAKNPYFDNNRGMLAIRIDRLDLSIKEVRTYDIYNLTTESDLMESWISNFMSTGDYFAFAISDEGIRKVTVSLKNKLKMLGSTLIDSVKYRESWAFLGSINGKILEGDAQNLSEKISLETSLQRVSKSGSLSFSSFASNRLKSFSLTNLSQSDTVFVSTFPENTESALNPLLKDKFTGNFDSVHVRLTNSLISELPKISFDEVIYDSPIKNGIQKAIDQNMIFKVGEPFNIGFTLFETEINNAETVSLKLTIKKSNTEKYTSEKNFVKDFLKKDVSFEIPSNTLIDSGDYEYTVSIISDGIYEGLSTIAGTFKIATTTSIDSSEFDLKIKTTINEREVEEKERILIPSHSKFEFEVSYSDFIPLTDTNFIFLKFNEEPLSLKNSIEFINEPSVRKTKIKVEKVLDEGNYSIKLSMKTPYGPYFKNEKVLEYDVTVKSEDDLYSVLNYPNPFSDFTNFSFTVSGLENPKSGKILVFTQNGLKIKTVDIFPSIGQNTVLWDGKDSDGDQIANGIYFYKVLIDFEHTKKEIVGKLFKLE